MYVYSNNLRRIQVNTIRFQLTSRDVTHLNECEGSLSVFLSYFSKKIGIKYYLFSREMV